jgi:arsenate reductase (glutaredoxin)
MMKIYHNPHCSKSRQALQLLQQSGREIEIIRYLDTPPDAATLRQLLQQLNLQPRQLLRQNEAIYKELELDRSDRDDAALIAIMVAHPRLIERPIVVIGDRAIIARPAERLLEIVS